MPIIFLRYVMMIIIILLVLVAAIVTWLLIKYGGARCPECGSRMEMTNFTDTTNVWTCKECGHKIVIEDYDE
jgi:DNA-directed RNA polymerase subunit RPC12/RpoP